MTPVEMPAIQMVLSCLPQEAQKVGLDQKKNFH